MTRQPLNSILFFTQPTILGQPNPLYGIIPLGTLTPLFALHAYYAGMARPNQSSRLTVSSAMREYLGRIINQLESFDPLNFPYVHFSKLISAAKIRALSPEELNDLIPEVTRVYRPLFPNLRVITPQDILDYQRDMVTLARTYKNERRIREKNALRLGQ